MIDELEEIERLELSCQKIQLARNFSLPGNISPAPAHTETEKSSSKIDFREPYYKTLHFTLNTAIPADTQNTDLQFTHSQDKLGEQVSQPPEGTES